MMSGHGMCRDETPGGRSQIDRTSSPAIKPRAMDSEIMSRNRSSSPGAMATIGRSETNIKSSAKQWRPNLKSIANVRMCTEA